MEAEFLRLLNNWYEETMFVSSITEICANKNYYRILRLGKAAIPFILKELQNKPSINLLIALRVIAGEDLVSEEHKGDMKKTIEAWLGWGKNLGYV